MLITALFGFLFGFIGSMPLAGPIAVLLVVRCLDDRFRSAYLIALGSVLPEALYGSLAFWGFATFLARYQWMVPVSHGAAAAILFVLGLSLVRRRGDPNLKSDEGAGAGSFTLGFLISTLNPSVIAVWTGATTTLFATGLVDFSPVLAIPFGLGAALGILSWYLVLFALIRRHKQRFTRDAIERAIRFFGYPVLGLSMWFLTRLFSALG